MSNLLYLIGCLSLSTNLLSLAWKRSIFGSEGRYGDIIKKSFAIKIVTKLALTAEDEAALKDEIRILKLGDHKRINKLHDFYDKKLFYYLLLEKMDRGELFDCIIAKAYYNEKEARDLWKIIFQTIVYCLKKRIANFNLNQRLQDEVWLYQFVLLI